jgi:hypothetical protein
MSARMSDAIHAEPVRYDQQPTHDNYKGQEDQAIEAPAEACAFQADARWSYEMTGPQAERIKKTKLWRVGLLREPRTNLLTVIQ